MRKAWVLFCRTQRDREPRNVGGEGVTCVILMLWQGEDLMLRAEASSPHWEAVGMCSVTLVWGALWPVAVTAGKEEGQIGKIF